MSEPKEKANTQNLGQGQAYQLIPDLHITCPHYVHVCQELEGTKTSSIEKIKSNRIGIITIQT